MTGAHLHQPLTVAIMAASWFAAGALLGFVHFRSLRWSVQCMLHGRALLAVSLQVLRFAAIGAVLTLVARSFGALPLLAGVLGLLATRTGLLMLEPQQ